MKLPPELPPLTVPPAIGGRLVLAYSGGLDSTVLLHCLVRQLGAARLLAAHVHHGLQPQAEAWAAQAAAAAAALGVTCRVQRVQVDPKHAGGPEAAARAARYAALRDLMQPGDALVTAHQREDQAETVLLRLLRGSGIDGLAALRELSEFAPGWLWRPLLEVPRAALQAYAQSHGLNWVEDPHNADPRYARSWLRTEVMPLLQRQFPQAPETLARTARLAAEAAEVLAAAAESELPELCCGRALRVAALAALPAGRRRNALRHWLRSQGYAVPPAEALVRLEREVLAADEAAEPILAWPGCELRRYRQLLYAMAPLPPPPQGQSLAWSEASVRLPPGCGELRLPGPPPQPLLVRFAHGGERFRPLGAKHRRTLKNLFQEAAVPPWLRSRTPLIERDGELVYVAGLGAGAGWHGAGVEWLGAPPGAPDAGT